MRGFIIDPANRSIIEITLPNGEQTRHIKIIELLGTDQFNITFIYPQEFTTCTAYLTEPIPKSPFFRVQGFVDKVKFGKTVVVDKTATGIPKSDNIKLSELEPMITFFP